MTDYERNLRRVYGQEGPWENYVQQKGPCFKDNHEETNGWGKPTALVDWARVEYDENRMNESVAQTHSFVDEYVEIINVDDKVSVFSFESSLDEDERDETFGELYESINWIESYREFRTLYPIDYLTYMLPGCGGEKVKIITI